MNQLALSFVNTRARRNDCDTSKEAAKAAAGQKAAHERTLIRAAVGSARFGLCAKEVARQTGIDFIEVSRRISECGLTKTAMRREGCAVWELTS
jgi:hypothetical protein